MEVVVFVIVVLAIAGWWGGRHSTVTGTPAPHSRRPGAAPYTDSSTTDASDDAFITGYLIGRHAYRHDQRSEKEQDHTFNGDSDDSWSDDCFED